MKPVIIVGAGPVGLTSALACVFYGLPVQQFEEDATLSVDTKAGTTLTRTLEAFRRYGVAAPVLEKALRIDEIGEIERATNKSTLSIRTAVLADDTRFPFVINLPQHHLEPILQAELEKRRPGTLHLEHRFLSYREAEDGIVARFATPGGEIEVDGSYLLACDGGRSAVRGELGIPVDGQSLDVRYMLVDFKVDLDVANPRDYPYLAYFSDPVEWMVLIRHPHCWRFLFPLAPGTDEPTPEAMREKVLRFIGDVADIELLGSVVYRIHHRIASRWSQGRVFLMGDAAHLITPMWALGLNTGILDALALPWRLAWVLRGWADPSLLDGYEREQKPLAEKGSGEMAEAARAYMDGKQGRTHALSGDDWANALTRGLLGTRLDVNGTGDWSLVTRERQALRPGDRVPDFPLHGASGHPCRLHDLTDDRFVALYMTDVRRRPVIPANDGGPLAHYAVSRWDAPLDSGLRDRALLDVGARLLERIGCPPDSLVLIRPDDHVAAIEPMRPGLAQDLYEKIVGRPLDYSGGEA